MKTAVGKSFKSFIYFLICRNPFSIAIYIAPLGKSWFWKWVSI